MYWQVSFAAAARKGLNGGFARFVIAVFLFFFSSSESFVGLGLGKIWNCFRFMWDIRLVEVNFFPLYFRVKLRLKFVIEKV